MTHKVVHLPRPRLLGVRPPLHPDAEALLRVEGEPVDVHAELAHPEHACDRCPTNSNALLANFALSSNEETFAINKHRLSMLQTCARHEKKKKTCMQCLCVPTELPICTPLLVVGASHHLPLRMVFFRTSLYTVASNLKMKKKISQVVYVGTCKPRIGK